MLSAAAAVLTLCFTGFGGEVHRGPLGAYDGATWEPVLCCLAGFLLGLVSYRFAASRLGVALLRCRLWRGCFSPAGQRGFTIGILPLFPLVLVTLMRIAAA